MESSETSDELDSWEVIPSPHEQQLRGQEEDPSALVREASCDDCALSPGAGSSASCSASFELDDQGSEQLSQPDSETHVTVQMGRQMRMMITSLRRRIASATSWLWPCSGCRAKAWSLSSVTVFMAAVGFVLAYAKMTSWHKQAMEESKSRLLVLLREQEEKISKLLVQIAQMNEILSARHKQAMEESKRKLLFLFREQEEKISKILVQLAQTNEILSARHRVPVLHTC